MSDNQRCDRCGKHSPHRISDGATELCPRCFSTAPRPDVLVPATIEVEGFDGGEAEA